MQRKIFECCICHKEIPKNIRLVHQIYDKKEPYGRYHNKNNYDFCEECFEIFKRWLKKHGN